MSGAPAERIIRTVRCPLCLQLPDLVLGPTQAFCGNDDCRALQFDPSMDPTEQVINGTELPINLVRAFGAGMSEAAAVERPRQVPGSAADDAREAEIRVHLHRYGYRCLPGACTICDAA